MITVNSISFSNSLRPSQPTTNRLVGNAGDVVVAALNVTTTQTLNDFAYYFNSLPNNQQIYSDSLTGGIFSTAFFSLTNNQNQSYIRVGGVLNPTNPRSFDSTISLVINSLGGFVYEIVHTFIIAPILRENELDNNIFLNPSYYSNNGLKYVFRLDLIVDGLTLETTDDVNLETSTIIRNGAVGGWGSSLGTGAINYNLIVTPNLIDINDTITTTHTAQIKKNSGAWLVTDLISYRLQAINEISSYNFSTSLLQNTKFDFVTHNVEDAPQNGANGFILDCFCEINGLDNTLLDITFSIAAGYGTEFAIFFGVSSNVLALEHQNVLATYGTASVQGDDSQVEFVNYAGFNANFKIGFVNWYNQTFIDEGFNHLRAYRKDDNEVFFGVRLVDLDATFVSLNCGFKDLDTGQFLTNETFNFDFTTTLPLQFDRGYIRKSDNPKKYIQVAYVGDRFQFRYGFNVGAEFLASDNIVFEANVNFVDSNGFALTNTIRSPFIEAGQYDVTQNTIAEPQVLANPIPQPKFYLVDGSNTPNFGTEYGGLIAGQNMFIEATFQDNNLNDLQANEIDLAGYFAITTPSELKEIERYFFSTYQSETDTPFEAINGHTAGLVKVTKVDIKTATLSAIINYDRLVVAFPNTRDLCIVARLDKPQPPLFPYYKDTSLHFASSDNGDTLITNPAVENWIQQRFFFDGNHIASNFRFKINTTGATSKGDASWALIPYINQATFEASAILTGYTIRIECIDLQGNTDVLALIQYISLVPTATPFSGTHLRKRQTALNDFLAFYKEDLTIASVTSTNTNRFQAVRNNAILDANGDLTNFATLNLTTLNSGLASSPQKYAHYFIDSLTAIDNTTTITGNFGALNRELIEYISPSKYDFAPFLTNKLSIFQDGINDSITSTTLNAFNFALIPNNTYMRVQCFIQEGGTSGIFSSVITSAINRAFVAWIDGAYINVAILTDGAASGQAACVMRAAIDTSTSSNLSIQLCLQKLGNPSLGRIDEFFNVGNSFAVVNGRKIPFVKRDNDRASTIPALGNTFYVGRFFSQFYGQFPSLVARRIEDFRMDLSLTPFTNLELRSYALGVKTQRDYVWNFAAVVSTNQLASTGTVAAGNLFLNNHTNTTVNFFD